MNERADLEVETLTIRIPMQLERRGGRKPIITPEGAVPPAQASAGTRRWSRPSFAPPPLAAHDRERPRTVDHRSRCPEGADAYICRLLPLTSLAPDIVAAILDGRQPKGLRLADRGALFIASSLPPRAEINRL
jgi:hypothetical protein